MSRQDPPKAVRIDSWGFDGNWPASRPGIPMIGIFLIIFGLLLGAGQLFNQAAIAGSALFLALGIVLLIVGLRDRSDFLREGLVDGKAGGGEDEHGHLVLLGDRPRHVVTQADRS